MIDFNLLRTFVTVAEKRRISQAAKLLDLPKSTVSRHIAKMEADLGVRLFDRHPDGFELTSFGRRLFHQTRPSINALNGVFSDTVIEDYADTLTIQTPGIYGRGVLGRIVGAFLNANPDCSVELQIVDRHTVPDPARADLNVCVGLSPGREFETWFLGFADAKLFASPSLFCDDPVPSNPTELANWPLLIDDCLPGERSRLNMIHKGRRISVSAGQTRLTTRDPEILVEGALSGNGIARLPVFTARPHLESGALVPILPDYFLDRWSVLLARPRSNNNRWASEFAEFACQILSEETVAI